MTLEIEHTLSVLRSVPKLRLSWIAGDDERVLFGTIQGTDVNRLLFLPSSDEIEREMAEHGLTVSIEAPTELGLCAVEAEITSTDATGYVSLRLTGAMRRIQRRDYVRIQMSGVDARGQLLDPAGNEIEELSISLLDLSGGGLRFATPIALEAGACVRVPLELVGDPLLEPIVVIVDSFNSPVSAAPGYVSRGYFRDIRESDRDRIVRFVMHEQLAGRRHKLTA